MEDIVLDIEPTTVLSADVGRAKINARPRKQRAPTSSHLRLRQQAAAGDVDDTDVNNSTDTAASAELVKAMSCRCYC